MQLLCVGISTLLLITLLPWPGADSGSTPQIHIETGGIGKMKVTCTSEDWSSQPEVQWWDLQRQHLVPSSETKTTRRNYAFHVETSVTVDTSSRDVSCVIRDPIFNEETEAHVSVSDALFPRLWPWIVGFAVPLCLLAVGIAFGVLFVKTRGQLARRKALGEEGLSILRTYAEDIILDEDTAHPRLHISEDKKSMRYVAAKQDVPDNPERFDIFRAVLGKNSFSAGNHYWEVGVQGKYWWVIGLCLDSVIRKGSISICPENGFWALSREGNNFRALCTPRSFLKVTVPPNVVGIFLQYEKGQIFFYNLSDRSCLFTFKCTFTEPLRPYFSPGLPILGNTKSIYLPKCP